MARILLGAGDMNQMNTIRIVGLGFLAFTSLTACNRSDRSKPSEKETTVSEPSGREAKAAGSATERGDEVVACDQRDFVPNLGPSSKPLLTCIDYSEHTGPLKPSCVQGKALDAPCPADELVATCRLSTNSVYKHYKGASLVSAERSCKLLSGTFATM
jgi:hypothetical protein